MPPVRAASIPGLTLFRQGKVREMYEVGTNHFLMVASDRISAFDVVMDDLIPRRAARAASAALRKLQGGSNKARDKEASRARKKPSRPIQCRASVAIVPRLHSRCRAIAMARTRTPPTIASGAMYRLPAVAAPISKSNSDRVAEVNLVSTKSMGSPLWN